MDRSAATIRGEARSARLAGLAAVRLAVRSTATRNRALVCTSADSWAAANRLAVRSGRGQWGDFHTSFGVLHLEGAGVPGQLELPPLRHTRTLPQGVFPCLNPGHRTLGAVNQLPPPSSPPAPRHPSSALHHAGLSWLPLLCSLFLGLRTPKGLPSLWVTGQLPPQ